MATKLTTIELGNPLPTFIEDAEAYDAVWAFVLRHGIPIGQVEIDNLGQPVTAVQLRSEIVRQLAHRVLDGRDYQNTDSFAWAVGQKERIPSRFATEPELAALLPELEPALGQTHFLSVVVCTRDRPDDLQICLSSLTQMNPGRHRLEIIVVDNNPDSGLTESIVAQFPTVRYEIEPRAGVAYGRNKGLLTAQGDIVAYIDDDVVAPTHWPTRILAPFADARVMCVSGLVMPLELESDSQEMFEKYGALGRGYKPRIFDKQFFWRSKKHVVHTWDLGGTANVAIRKSVLPESGLFDETLGPGLPTGVGEDIYMFYRILKYGHLCYYEPAAYVWHKHRDNMKALRKQLYNYNKGQTSYQLRTLVTDGDRRAARQLVWDLPRWHLRRIWEMVRGRQDYLLRLAAVEIAGNVMGFSAFWKANWMHRQLNGRNANPIGSVREGTEANLPPQIVALTAQPDPQTTAVMFHIGRSGSTVLGDLLNQHAQLQWGGEIYLPIMQEWAQKQGRDGNGRLIDPVKQAAAKIKCAEKTSYGFEVKFFHLDRLHVGLPAYIDGLMALGVDRFVILRRRNTLRKIVSSMVARQEKLYHLPAGERPSFTPIRLEPARVTIDLTEKPLLAFLESYEASFQALSALLADKRCLQLIYEEDVLHDPQRGYRRICEFMGLASEPAVVRYGRSNPFPLSEILLNYDEVAAALAGTPFAWMMDE